MRGIDNLLDNVLCATSSDTVLVAGDCARENLVSAVSQSLSQRQIPHTCHSEDYDGKHVPPDLAAKLLDDEHNVLVLLFGRSIWHQPERRAAKYDKMKRLVAYSGTLEMLGEGPALADPQQVEMLCRDLQPIIGQGSHILLEGPGTQISGICSHLGFETGRYAHPGEGGNFPAAEIYSFGLEEETIEGYVHSNIKVKHLGLCAPGNDAIFTVNEGRLTLGDAPAFSRLICEHPELFSVAELAFGICPNPTVFPYPDSIQEEKILGTAHVGLGSNISFGGSRRGKHLDVVFGPASVFVDGKRILTDGRINGSYLSEQSREWLTKTGFAYDP